MRLKARSERKLLLKKRKQRGDWAEHKTKAIKAFFRTQHNNIILAALFSTFKMEVIVHGLWNRRCADDRSGGISLTDTCVQTIKAYRKKGGKLDIELLIEEVRITALQRIDEADFALMQLERTLVEKGVDTGWSLQDVISRTSFWHPFEAHRLKRIRKSFDALADAIYSAIDDVASLVRCRNQTSQMGSAVVESAYAKHMLHEQVVHAKSVKEAINLLRGELLRNKEALM
jgi:hypothetical protein